MAGLVEREGNYQAVGRSFLDYGIADDVFEKQILGKHFQLQKREKIHHKSLNAK